MKISIVCVVAALIFAPAFADNPKTPPKEETITLDSLKVSVRPSSSFPIELEVRVSSKERKVLIVFIVGLQPDSDASDADLQPGDKSSKSTAVLSRAWMDASISSPNSRRS